MEFRFKSICTLQIHIIQKELVHLMQKEYACQRTKKSITQSNLILSDPQMLKCVNTILGPVFFSEFIHECLLKYYKGYNSKSHLCFCVMIQRSKYHVIFFFFDERKVFCV